MKFLFSAAILAVAALGPTSDLLQTVKSGRQISFETILNAKMADDGGFEALRAWAEKPTAEELSTHYKRRPGPKAFYAELVPCWEADHKGVIRAMTVAASASDRKAAIAAWAKTTNVFAQATAKERREVTKARSEAKSRPTAVGRELAIRVARDQVWKVAQSTEEFDDRTNEAIFWRLWPRVCRVGSENTAFVKSIIREGHWPLKSKDGEAASHDAFLIVQHADDDPDFQATMLTFLKPLVARGEFSKDIWAALFDRVALAQGRPQRYGTQFGNGRAGCAAARPTEDPANIDRRRSEIGLNPIAEYATKLSAVSHLKICANIFDSDEKLP